MDDDKRSSATMDEANAVSTTADDGNVPLASELVPRMNRHQRRAQKHRKKARRPRATNTREG